MTQKSNVAVTIANANNDDTEFTVIGGKQNIPYDLSYINQANTNLYGPSVTPKTATHDYVKFSPTSLDHVAKLSKWSVEQHVPIFDFPLDVEVTTMGSKYVDPGVTEDLLTYQYANIPSGTPLPNVPSQVITQRYYNDADVLLIAESFKLAGRANEVNAYIHNNQGIDPATLDDDVVNASPVEPECEEGFRPRLVFDMSTNPPELVWECFRIPLEPSDPFQFPQNACGCDIPWNKRNPAGCIRVDRDGTLDGVRIARVLMMDHLFKWRSTETDVAGCWSIDSNFSGRVRMWVTFANADVRVRDLRFYLSLRSVKDYVGRFNAPPYNNIEVEYGAAVGNNNSNARMHWAAAHTLNTVNRYRTFAGQDGIPLPRVGLSWVNFAADFPASAAMLQDNQDNWVTFIQVISGLPGDIAALFNAYPDITNPYEAGETAIDYTAIGHHELGHASHYSVVGEPYWIPYRVHVLANNGAGDFGNFTPLLSDPNRVALGEALAEFTESIYGRPLLGEGNGFLGNYVPAGLMWDLTDTGPPDVITDPNTGVTGTDNIEGFTRAMIFDAAVPGVNSIRNYRDELRTLHLASTPNTAADFNALLDLYDVFN